MTEKLLFILADDHRDSLEKDLYKLTEAPTDVQAARIRADKQLVFEALVDATHRLSDQAQAGILVDEEFGSDVAIAAGETHGKIDLSMPLEASGKAWFEFNYGEAWQQHATMFPTDHAKILIRDNPAVDAKDRATQAGLVKQVSDWAIAAHKHLIIELLVPATQDQLASVGGDAKRYDNELRPKLTIESIAYLQAAGANPALWKVEGMNSTEDAAAVVTQAHANGLTADCIVLGRHASKDDLDHWLQIAAPIDGYVGFAIGRSIWWDALVDHLAGTIGSDVARARITSTYLDFANAYLAARQPQG